MAELFNSTIVRCQHLQISQFGPLFFEGLFSSGFVSFEGATQSGTLSQELF